MKTWCNIWYYCLSNGYRVIETNLMVAVVSKLKNAVGLRSFTLIESVHTAGTTVCWLEWGPWRDGVLCAGRKEVCSSAWWRARCGGHLFILDIASGALVGGSCYYSFVYYDGLCKDISGEYVKKGNSLFILFFFFFLRSPAISLGFTTFGWDFCICDRFLIQPLR